MKKLLTLMQREWLQHRFGWAMLTLLPIALALLLTTFGQIELGSEEVERMGAAMPMIVAMVSIAATTAILFVIIVFTSWIIVSGLARRDHGDRSIEFWLSLPVTHSEALAAPMLVHLLLAPAVALLIGLLGGYAVSLVVVSRVMGIGAWFALPWFSIITASVAFMARLLAGLPLALLWLSPLILLVVLTTAYFKRWAWVILGVGVGLGSVLLQQVFGHPMLMQTIKGLVTHAGLALFSAHQTGFNVAGPGDAFDALRAVPSWALADFGVALGDLASPLLAAGLMFAALCFVLLVQWRERGAGV
jgi:hypothetical protein